MRGVVGTGESAKRGRNCAHAERRGNTHNRAEKQLRPEARQGYVPKLLPTVAYSVNIARLIKGFIHALKTCHKGKESRSQAHPKTYYNNKRQHILSVGKPLNRLGYKVKTH